ncbi:hypothetical protein CKO27_13975 [Thiocystis violacea]|nr:hypothetical protein [Thiocystis violacea]
MKRNIGILRVLRWVFVLLLAVAGLLMVVLSRLFVFWPMLPMALLGLVSALLVWSLTRGMIDTAEQRLREAAWLFASVTPADATLLFNQALVWEGLVSVVLMKEPPARKQVCVFQLSKFDYPKQTRSQITVYDSSRSRTLLIRRSGKYFIGVKIDQAGLAKQKRRFARLINVVLFLNGALFAAFGGWMLVQAWEMQQGLICIEASVHWPQATAEIRQVDVVEESRTTRSGKARAVWIPRVTYQYEWAGEPRQASRLGCVERAWSHRSAAHAVLAPFAPGSLYPLWIDPARLERTRLIADDPRWVKDQRNQFLGGFVSITLAGLLAHLLIGRLLARLNLRRLGEIEDEVRN